MAWGFLPFSNAVHYSERGEQFRQLVQEQVLPTGYATDAGAGLHFEQMELVAAISDRKNAGAYRIERRADGTTNEEAIEVCRLKRS